MNKLIGNLKNSARHHSLNEDNKGIINKGIVKGLAEYDSEWLKDFKEKETYQVWYDKEKENETSI